MDVTGRRDFLKKSLLSLGGLYLYDSTIISMNTRNKSLGSSQMIAGKSHMKSIRIEDVDANFERESLRAPFGFKGGYLSELWQPVSYLRAASGNHAIGLGTQSVLWSDAEIFSTYTESGGNALMYLLTEKALQLLRGTTYTSPMDLIDPLYEEIYRQGVKITGNTALRKTFALNALVSVDNALWLLYAREHNIRDFDQLIPDTFKKTFPEKHEKVAAIPLISYNVKPSEILAEAREGYFFMKIKIGQPGTQAEMLRKDMDRLTEIHDVLKDFRTPTPSRVNCLTTLMQTDATRARRPSCASWITRARLAHSIK